MSSYPYSAIRIVSPAMYSGESKDHDRAHFHEPCQTACVSDGVTTSPYSQKAAELITAVIPCVFEKDTVARLGMIADSLMNHRKEAGIERPSLTKNGYSENMQKMMFNIITLKMAVSFQATLIAARFSTNENGVTADIIKCGDSGFFAFSDKGQLLSSSLQLNNHFPEKVSERKRQGIIFGPASEVLVRVEGRLSDNKKLMANSGIQPRFAVNWLVCTPVDICDGQKSSGKNKLCQMKPLRLSKDDRLLVPEYLYGKILTSHGRHYRVLSFSSTIKAVSDVPARTHKSFSEKGSATHVLPDHFYTGDYDLVKDSFPLNTNFLLCSDGFYSAFGDFGEMFSWLRNNEQKLNKAAPDQDGVMEQLHLKLGKKSGDDDISLVWARPNKGGKPDVR